MCVCVCVSWNTLPTHLKLVLVISTLFYKSKESLRSIPFFVVSVVRAVRHSRPSLTTKSFPNVFHDFPTFDGPAGINIDTPVYRNDNGLHWMALISTDTTMTQTHVCSHVAHIVTNILVVLDGIGRESWNTFHTLLK